MQQQAEPVVVEIAESVTDALDFFDQQVGRFGGSVGDTAGVEVGQQFGTPGIEGTSQAGELGDVSVGAVGQPPVEQPVGASPIAAVVDQPEVLGGDPGSGELLIRGVTGVEAGQQSLPRALAVVVIASAQQPADALERILTAAAAPGVLALDASTDLVDSGEGQTHDVEGVEHPDRIGQRGAQRAGVAPVGIQRGGHDPGPPHRVPLADPPDQC